MVVNGRSKRTLKHRVDHLKCLIDLLAHLRTSQDNLSRHEDKQDNLRLDHAIDKTREQLWLIRAEVVMLRRKTLQTDWELDVARADNVLDFEVGELGIEPELLDDTSVLARGKLAVVLRLGAGNNHLARGENQCSGLWLTDAHNNSRKALALLAINESQKEERQSLRVSMYLWVVFSVSRMKSDRLEVQAAIEVDRGNDVS